MFEKIKIAFFDLDGTLLNDHKIISQEDILTIKMLKEMGITIVLASGRYDKYVNKYAQILGCVDYLITNNGALVLDSHYNIIFKDVFNKIILKKLWEYATTEKIGLTLNTKGSRYSNVWATTNANDNTIIDKIDEKIEAYQLVFSSSDKEKIKSLISYLKDEKVHITYISKSYYTNRITQSISVDVNLNQVSKGQAIKHLLNKLHLDKDNAICFGDNINDQEMFNACQYSVIMDNAQDELKKEAKYITLDNNHSGITYFINKNLKKEEI